MYIYIYMNGQTGKTKAIKRTAICWHHRGPIERPRKLVEHSNPPFRGELRGNPQLGPIMPRNFRVSDSRVKLFQSGRFVIILLSIAAKNQNPISYFLFINELSIIECQIL